MKVGIVTLHNTHNCGSYLQAIALCEYVKSIGYDARFVKNKPHFGSTPVYKFMQASKYLLKGDLKKASFIMKGCSEFIKARKKQAYFSSLKGLSAAIYGSDTIWNINSTYLRKQQKHYFGENNNGFKIAYAPSIGETSVETISSIPALCKAINNFSALSVRDEKTYNVVATAVGGNADITYVVDPTMLMPKSFYLQMAKECHDDNFILFYYFGSIDKAYMEQIKKYASENGKKLICFGDNIKEADKQIPFNPLDMLGYYSKADMVITNTFHGNVFSIIFNKQFVNIDAGKSKVDDLLEGFGLTERTAKSADDIGGIFCSKIDFDNVNSILEEKRAASGKYLENALLECERRTCDAR